MSVGNRFKFIWLILSFALAWVYVPLISLATTNYCINRLTPLSDTANNLRELPHVSHSVIPFNSQQIDVNNQFFSREQVSEVKGSRSLKEGKIIKISKLHPNKKWGSTFAPPQNRYAVELNPMWPIYILQQRVAHFFGIRQISPQTILGPDSVLLNQRIDKMNQLLKKMGAEEIPIRFYGQADAKQEQKKYPSYAEMYVRRMIEKDEHPLAEDEYIHDLSAHSLSILLTQSSLSAFKKRGRALIKFVDELRKGDDLDGFSSRFQSPEFREVLIRSLFRMFSYDADNFTGQIPWMTASILYRDTKNATIRFNLRQIGNTAGFAYMKAENMRLTTWLGGFLEGFTKVLDFSTVQPGHSVPGVILLEKNKAILKQIVDDSHSIEMELMAFKNRINRKTGAFNEMLFEEDQHQYQVLSEYIERVRELQKAVNSSVVWPSYSPVQIEESLK